MAKVLSALGMVARYEIEELSGIPVDSLAALRLAWEKGAATLRIVNVLGSGIAREADKVMCTLAGSEISVAMTKAYSTQLIAVYLLGIQCAKVRGRLEADWYRQLVSELLALPEKIQKILESKERIQWFACRVFSTSW